VIPPGRQALAEGLGTALLTACVIGTGLMATGTGADPARALWSNAAATAALLVVLITVLAPVSGAAFNPALTLLLDRRPMPLRSTLILAQVAGALAGMVLAHAMFDLDLIQIGTTPRTGPAQWLAEAVAAAGLILTVAGGQRTAPQAAPLRVGLYVLAAYWFTASTSFANPALTLARGLTDSFAGIRPADVPAFLIAQLTGALAGAALARALWPQPSQS
jgi:glycerol uptake facilitator-like aquaporin